MERYIDERGGKCEGCGRTYPSEIYHFHHKNPKDKEFHLNLSAWANEERARKEADKCHIVCPTCHALEHYYLHRGGKYLREPTT